MSIEDKIKEIVASVCKVNQSEISMNTSIGDFPEWDSLGHINIITDVSKEFGIEVEPEDLMEIENVGDIVQLVTRKRK